MHPTALRSLALVAVLAAVVPTSCGAAQPAPGGGSAARSAPGAEAGRSAPAAPIVDDADADEIRRDFMEILRRYPPSLGQVLRLDPTLLDSEPYLQAYPALAAFLAENPNVRHNPAYYLQHVSLPDNDGPRDARSQAVMVWRDMFEGISVFVVLVTIILSLLWCLRTIIDHRRWGRLQRVQTEVHSKLLDRFSATDDLLRYAQTPAGRRFLESAPIPLEGPRALSAPLGRILWSVQVGLVLAMGGAGLQFVSARVVDEVSSPLFAIGTLALFLGVGFILAAVASFVLSRRLGLLDAATQAAAPGEGGASQ
jgi:hypothetical protein